MTQMIDDITAADVGAVVMGHHRPCLAFTGFISIDMESVQCHANVADGLEAWIG